MTEHTIESLKNFEQWTIETFNAGKLRSPVHLSGGNEKELIEIFKDIRPQDWCFTTYRSHYAALLKGVPEERLKAWISDNKSIHFMDSEYKVFSSAIVGGCLPIALGVAMAIKRKWKPENWSEELKYDMIDKHPHPHVYCFIGDMTASLGVFNDCLTYAVANKLPITFVIEDNGLSTDTPTSEAWGYDVSKNLQVTAEMYPDYVKYYSYKRIFPHYGSGMFVKSLWKDIIDENDPRKKGF